MAPKIKSQANKHNKIQTNPQTQTIKTPPVVQTVKFNESKQQNPPLDSFEIQSNYHKSVEHDMWKHLKPVSIPVFSGDVRSYQTWKSAFMTCIDQSSATSVYKLLQLRQYLAGEALKVVDSLGHSAIAYDIALERLERKYGGRRRLIAIQMEELHNFKPIREGHAQDVERFADLLDVTVVHLIDTDMVEELGNGLFYATLLKKMTQSMVVSFQRWLFDNCRQESVEVLREWILQEAEFLTVASEAVYGVSKRSFKHDHRVASDSKKKMSCFVSSKIETNTSQLNKINQCSICSAQHEIWRCRTFRGMQVPDRWKTITKHKLCYLCLGKGHSSKTCTRLVQCGINGCTKKHNRMLHSETSSGKVSSEPPCHDAQNTNHDFDEQHSEVKVVEDERSHTTVPYLLPRAVIALRTAPVVIRNGKKSITVNALLDDASTRSYINEDVASELGLQGKIQKVSVNVLNGKTETFETQPVEFMLQSIDGSIKTKMSALTTTKVTGNMGVIDWQKHKNKWNHLKDIDFPNVASCQKVDILIGIDYLDLHCSYEEVRGNPGEPFARRTPLGWTCIGNVGSKSSHTGFSDVFFTNETDVELNALMHRFWDIDDFKPESSIVLSPNDKIAMTKVQETLLYEKGSYEVGIPWKIDPKTLPDNYDMAFSRLTNIEKKLSKNESVANAYEDVIQQYLHKGYIRKVPAQEVDTGGQWFLPHFPIIKPDRSTTKVRLVYDASAKYDGVSLNDAIYPGPKLQRELLDVLLRFRKHPVALVCDIEAMYLQIKIPPSDRPYHRFLWRSLDRNIPPDIYEFSRVVFGVTSSPFLAQYVTQEHAKIHARQFPLAAETVIKSTYMDDGMDSVENEEKGVELYKQLAELWSKAGMHARKWLSNSVHVLEHIPSEDRASEIDLGKGRLPTTKTLGLLWKAETDIFTFKSDVPSKSDNVTKRSILSDVAKLFDPLGFVAPFIITAKILLQQAWMTGISWDDDITGDLKEKMKTWLQEVAELKDLEIPRCLSIEHTYLVAYHVFVDASKDAFGAVVYAVHEYANGTKSSRLIVAKSRVAPLKAVSIPRLELMAAMVGLRLAATVSKALKFEIQTVTFWSDSLNVLCWIKSNSRSFKPFVANRTGEIQSLTNPSQWFHVPTGLNPADMITRGVSASQLIDSTFWWHGPPFLEHDESEWPPQGGHYNSEVQDSSLVVTPADAEFKLKPTRFSSWQRLVRVTAWVYRFLHNCLSVPEMKKMGEMTLDEIKDAEMKILTKVQKDEFPEEYQALSKGKLISSNSKLISLQPVLDDDGIMRLHGRLEHADCLSLESRFPIILPRYHWVTKLIVKHYHEMGHHVMGTNQTLSLISARFWIISGREHECARCKKAKAKPVHPVMAPLPKFRVQPSFRAFTETGVDFAGPFFTIQGRGKKRQKRYLCLFTCLKTRAVHLELAFGLDTDSFLSAFFRMVNRRGLPQLMLSDNGTNFVGAVKELKELTQQMDKDIISRSLANRGVKWLFNPPHAPHFGGVFETMIKAAKRAIFAILSKCDVTDEELMTAMTGAESLINSRPLTYKTAHRNDASPLTPNHFLHGQIGGIFAPESVDSTDFHPQKHWRRLQELVRHFWRRWMREWLPSLNSRKKWTKIRPDPRVNDVVLVISPNTPRGQWQLGTVVRTYPGVDGAVRVIDVQVGKSILTRAVSRICPLEWNPLDDESPDARTTNLEEEESRRKDQDPWRKDQDPGDPWRKDQDPGDAWIKTLG